MTESFVRLPADGDGKKLRTLEKSINGNNVHQEIITLANEDGTLIKPATFEKQNEIIDEIKNISNKISIQTIGDFNAILSVDVVEFQKSKINVFGSSIIVPSNTLTIASYTVPVGKTFTFSGGIIGGDESGEFYFEIDNNVIALARNSGSNRTIFFKFLEAPTAGSGSVINIRAKNIGHRTKQYEATLSGYTINV
jgi:hypothetical protein